MLRSKRSTSILSTYLALVTALFFLALAPLAQAQETPTAEEPYLVVGGFTTVLAAPDLNAEVLGRPGNAELTITGISADGSFYRVDFDGQEGWVHQSAVQKIVGDLDAVPVISPPTQSTPTAPSGRPVQQNVTPRLHDYDQGWSSAVAELQDAGMIPKGGTLLFEENYAFLSGHGNFFIPLGEGYPDTDIIMAADMTYTVGTQTEYEECGLFSRIETNQRGSAVRYLEVSLDNDHDVTFRDIFGPGDTQANLDYVDSNIDLTVSHHLLIMALDDRLTVFLDGEMVTNDFEIAVHAGTYGLGLHGRGNDTRCEGRNIWVYQVPFAQAGTCEVHVDRPVNMRSGPGTNYDQAGRLTSGSTRQVIAATLGEDGYIWWQLENSYWVRNDIVDAYGDCQNVPGPGESNRI